MTPAEARLIHLTRPESRMTQKYTSKFPNRCPLQIHTNPLPKKPSSSFFFVILFYRSHTAQELGSTAGVGPGPDDEASPLPHVAVLFSASKDGRIRGQKYQAIANNYPDTHIS